MGEVARKITWCDLLIVVGTSSTVSFYNYLISLILFFDDTEFNLRQVQPASGFASQVKEHNGKVAIFDINPPNKSDEADFIFLGSCDVSLLT
jgi:NAD-dependent deacetylase sirtuin 5